MQCIVCKRSLDLAKAGQSLCEVCQPLVQIQTTIATANASHPNLPAVAQNLRLAHVVITKLLSTQDLPTQAYLVPAPVTPQELLHPPTPRVEEVFITTQDCIEATLPSGLFDVPAQGTLCPAHQPEPIWQPDPAPILRSLFNGTRGVRIGNAVSRSRSPPR